MISNDSKHINHRNTQKNPNFCQITPSAYLNIAKMHNKTSM